MSSTAGEQDSSDGTAEDTADDTVDHTADDTVDHTADHTADDTPDDGYAHLAPLFDELVTLDESDPRRERLRGELVAGYLPVAQHIARRFANRGEPQADLEQVATIGLINAVDRYDPSRGVEFLSYAIPTITGEVRRHFRDRGWAMRVPRRLKDLHLRLSSAMSELSQRTGRAPTASELAEHLDLPYEEVVQGLAAANAYRGKSLDHAVTEQGATLADTLGQADAELERVEYREALQPLLARLPDRERTILKLRFFANLTQTQIAHRIGISQMHVSRLLARTLETLRDELDRDEPAHRAASTAPRRSSSDSAGSARRSSRHRP